MPESRRVRRALLRPEHRPAVATADNHTRTAASVRAVGARVAWLFVCGFLPLVALFYVFGTPQAPDFHFAYYPAAEAILAGEDFYPTHGFVVRGEQELIVDYVYPPLTAIATIPWTVLSVGVAEVVFAALLVVAVIATLAVLGVRDWRCYGLAFVWPPVTDAVSLGNVSILLGLAAALVWRFRDRPFASGAALGVSVATKIFLWPLTIWLAATRRISAAVWSVVIALGLLFVTWGAIGFRGLSEYPGLVRRLGEVMDERSYTVYALAVDLGVSDGLARALWLALAAGILAAMVVVARRGDEARAFVLALAAAIAFSPIVWLHYFALLLVVVAVVQPRLGPLWFLGFPMQVFITTGVYNGSTFQTAAMLGTAALTFALALSRTSLKPRRLELSSPAAARS